MGIEMHALHARLSEPRWRVGFYRSGARAGAPILLWPLLGNKIAWDGLWEATFASHSSGEIGDDNSIVFSREDAHALSELELANVEWVADPLQARRVVLEEFPDSRAAHEAT